MDRQTRYPKEVRERAVRLVFEHEREHPSQWAAICSIALRKAALGLQARPRPSAPRRPARQSQAHRTPLARARLHAAGAAPAQEAAQRRARADPAAHPNHVWTYDFIFDATAGGRRLKILSVLDEFTREALALVPRRSLTSAHVSASWPSSSPSVAGRRSSAVQWS